MKREKDNDRDSSDDSDTETTENDIYALPYSSSKKYKRIKPIQELNKLGFGAGGLLPLTFSHLSRNWCTLPSKVGGRSATFGDQLPSEDEEEEEEEEGFFGPGTKLLNLPWIEMQSGDITDEEQGEDGALRLSLDGEESTRGVQGTDMESSGLIPAAKRPRVGPSGPEATTAMVRVPSTLVRRNDGGRGKTRFRLSRTQEGQWVMAHAATG